MWRQINDQKIQSEILYTVDILNTESAQVGLALYNGVTRLSFHNRSYLFLGPGMA